jgi:hypothetical protein
MGVRPWANEVLLFALPASVSRRMTLMLASRSWDLRHSV